MTAHDSVKLEHAEHLLSLADHRTWPVEVGMLIDLGVTALDIDEACEAVALAYRINDEAAYFRTVIWRRIAQRRYEAAHDAGQVVIELFEGTGTVAP